MDSSDSTISMLSKYNLKVGGNYHLYDNSTMQYTSIDHPSGIQNVIVLVVQDILMEKTIIR